MRDTTMFVPVHSGIWSSRKIIQLTIALDVSDVTVVGHLVSLWTAALEQAPDGDLSGWSTKAIAASSRWRGDSELFANELVDAGILIRGSDGSTILNDWALYAGKGIEKRAKARTRMAKARAEKQANAGTTDGERSGTVRERSANSGEGSETVDPHEWGVGSGKGEVVSSTSSQTPTTRGACEQPPANDDTYDGMDAFEDRFQPPLPKPNALGPVQPGCKDACREWCEAVAAAKSAAHSVSLVWGHVASRFASRFSEVVAAKGEGAALAGIESHLRDPFQIGALKDTPYKVLVSRIEGKRVDAITGAGKKQSDLWVERGPKPKDIPPVDEEQMNAAGYTDYDEFEADFDTGKLTKERILQVKAEVDAKRKQQEEEAV